MPNSLAIITTCKGRLDFLRQTLPRFVASGLPVTVVDYDCPQQVSAYVSANFPAVRVVAVKDRPNWNLAEARNLGAQGIAQDFLLFLDSDLVLGDAFGDFLSSRKLAEDEFFRGPLGDLQLWGQCLIPRRRFEAVGFYDEAIVGWGYEDEDLYRRLRSCGLRQSSFPEGVFHALPHGDELRTQFNVERSKWANQRINSIYSSVKGDIETLEHNVLSLDRRQSLRSNIEALITEAVTSGGGAKLVFEVQLSSWRSQAPTGYLCRRTIKYNLTLD